MRFIEGKTTLRELSKEDAKIIDEHEAPYVAALPDRLYASLLELEHAPTGFRSVTRLDHSLMCASWAHRDGHDEEYVVAALLHDIGDILCPANHAEFAADILKPYVREEIDWIIRKHEIFQGWYLWHLWAQDRNARDVYRATAFSRLRRVLRTLRSAGDRSLLPRDAACRILQADDRPGDRQALDEIPGIRALHRNGGNG